MCLFIIIYTVDFMEGFLDWSHTDSPAQCLKYAWGYHCPMGSDKTRVLTRPFPKDTMAFGGSLGLPQTTLGPPHIFNSHFNY